MMHKNQNYIFGMVSQISQSVFDARKVQKQLISGSPRTYCLLLIMGIVQIWNHCIQAPHFKEWIMTFGLKEMTLICFFLLTVLEINLCYGRILLNSSLFYLWSTSILGPFTVSSLFLGQIDGAILFSTFMWAIHSLIVS